MPEPEGDALPSLDFERAQVPSAGPACAVCGRPIEREYFEAVGKIVCGGCRAEVERSHQGGSRVRRVARALGAGLGAVVVCAGAWAAVLALTGSEFGLLAIGMGLVVGGAVRWGSDRRGGAGYQALAIVLTYIAVAEGSTPLIYSTFVADRPSMSALGHAVAMVFAAVFALATPFLGIATEGVSGILGLVILAIALYEAWKINRGVTIRFSGPHPVRLAPSAPAAGVSAVADGAAPVLGADA